MTTEVTQASAAPPGEARSARPRGFRARVRRAHRFFIAFILLTPALWIGAGDLVRRFTHIGGFDALHTFGYLASIVGSGAVYAALLYVAAAKRGPLRQAAAGCFAVLFTFGTGIQNAFFGFYKAYLSRDTSTDLDSFLWAITGAVPFDRTRTVLPFALSLALSLGLLVVARLYLRPRRIKADRYLRPLAFAAALIFPFSIPVSYRAVQSTSPDLVYFNSLSVHVNERLRTALTKEPRLVRGQRRHPDPVPALTAKPARPRNVLMILQESQRADVTCLDYSPTCPLATPDSNKAAPNRIPFLQLRSNTSSTAIAMVALWAVIDPTESKERIHSAPVLWEYARAAGYDTAYWTSQALMFGNARLYVQDAAINHFVGGNELSSKCDWVAGSDDILAADRAIADWGKLKEPFVAVLHLANIHRPRRIDTENPLFKPTNLTEKGTRGTEGKNHYKNAVALSDRAVAKLINHVRQTESGTRTVIVYTSDHAESFLEHKNENDHAGSVYDEELRVPGWIDAPPGTLAPQEERFLRRARTEYIYQLDLGATMLDLLGIWDDPGFLPFRQKMIGHPLTRAERTTGPVPITNISWVWEYQRANYGLMQGTMKVHAAFADKEYKCFNIAKDPAEQHDLGEEKCGPLLQKTRDFYRIQPHELDKLAKHPEWAAR
jgi:glucan phosphoethanolaminetransferase (alkaline phosphatase superfamily)